MYLLLLLLLQYKNRRGETAIELAKKYERENIVRYLSGSRNIEDMLDPSEGFISPINAYSRTPVKPRTISTQPVGGRSYYFYIIQ